MTDADDDDAALKDRNRAIWASGDYAAMVEAYLLPLGARLVQAAGITAGERVLDVACGTGNAALPAALAGADVVASDLTPELLDAGRARAAQAGAELRWVAADAERLPFDEASFDVVMSSIGVMFAPDQQAAADELVRVCRPGGRIALLSWTPEGAIGGLFRTLGAFAPAPPAGARSPLLWGTREHLAELFGDRLAVTSAQRGLLPITAFATVADIAEHYRSWFGPAVAARAHAADGGRETEFDAALHAFCEEANAGTAEQARLELEYLLAVGTRA